MAIVISYDWSLTPRLTAKFSDYGVIINPLGKKSQLLQQQPTHLHVKLLGRSVERLLVRC